MRDFRWYAMCMDCSEVNFNPGCYVLSWHGTCPHQEVVGSYHFFAIIFFQSISRPVLSCFKVTSSLCFNFFTPLLNLCSMHCSTFLSLQLLHFCFVPTCIEVGVSREVVIYFLVFKHSCFFVCSESSLYSLQLLCFYLIPLCAFWVAFFNFLVFRHSMLLSTLRELSLLSTSSLP